MRGPEMRPRMPFFLEIAYLIKEALNKSLLTQRQLCAMSCAKGSELCRISYDHPDFTSNALDEDLFSASLADC